MPSDDDLLERTLAFSGSYVSDDGHVEVRRSLGRSAEYSGERFVGFCAVCSRSRLSPPDGEPLTDLRAAVHFLVEHAHGESD